jgi:hypothetical protein
LIEVIVTTTGEGVDLDEILEIRDIASDPLILKLGCLECFFAAIDHPDIPLH